MNKNEFDHIIDLLYIDIERSCGKKPHYVHFSNKQVSDNNVMFLIKMNCVANGLSKNSGMIISITNVKSAIGQEIIIISPVYSYDNVTSQKEEDCISMIGDMLEKICKKNQVGNNNYMVICETGDFKIQLKVKPDISENGDIVRVS